MFVKTCLSMPAAMAEQRSRSRSPEPLSALAQANIAAAAAAAAALPPDWARYSCRKKCALGVGFNIPNDSSGGPPCSCGDKPPGKRRLCCFREGHPEHLHEHMCHEAVYLGCSYIPKLQIYVLIKCGLQHAFCNFMFF